MKRFRRAVYVVGDATRSFFVDEGLTHSAALAFFTVLSLAPILVLLLWLSAGLGPEIQQQLTAHLSTLIGVQGAAVVDMVVDNADRNVHFATFAGWFGLGTLLVSATAVLAQLQVSLNEIWEVVPQHKGLGTIAWLRKRLLSLGLIMSIGFLLLVSLVLTSVLAAMIASVNERLPAVSVLWVVVDVVVPFLVYSLMFMALFRYVPDVRLRWRHVAFGGFVTASLFVVGKWVIGLYVGASAVGSAYGAAGSLAVMMLWSYYAAAIVLFGAELTHAHVKQRARLRGQPTKALAPDERFDEAATPATSEPPGSASARR